jgi:diadenosine tetraphosphate (Ap4A) HIT family hydrolase
MALHQDNCEICTRVAQCRDGSHLGLIAELDTGYAVLGDSQFFRGYSVLLCKEPATELDELPHAFRVRYLEEMSQLASAVRKVTKAHKINYECLGNMVPHLHFHVFPRQLTDPAPLAPVWGQMPSGDDAAKYKLDASRDASLKSDIRRAIEEIRTAR